MEKIFCPHCEKQVFPTKSPFASDFVLDKMGHDWHRKCWEEFVKEYNDYLDSTDLNGKEN